MGFLAEKNNKDSKYEMGAVQTAFKDYYEWVIATTSDDERARWNWSVVTAENHLCKHSCLYEWVSALEG